MSVERALRHFFTLILNSEPFKFRIIEKVNIVACAPGFVCAYLYRCIIFLMSALESFLISLITKTAIVSHSEQQQFSVIHGKFKLMFDVSSFKCREVGGKENMILSSSKTIRVNVETVNPPAVFCKSLNMLWSWVFHPEF